MTGASLPLLLLLLLALCASAELIRVDRSSRRFVDSAGRQRIFHGVNAVYKTAPWLPLDGPFDHRHSLTERDMDDLAAWGFNVVRLGVMWPGAEPQRGVWDEAYLARVRATVDALGKRGIFTIADAHQDLLGRSLCGEGAPDWAIVIPSEGHRPFPLPVVDHTLPVDAQGYPEVSACLQKKFAKYYLSDAVGAAFQSLYDNREGIQDEFAEFWRRVAAQLNTSETLLAYELLNEPWAGDTHKDFTLWIPGVAGKRNLAPMYSRLHKVIRGVDDEHVIMFEKAISNPLGPDGLAKGPGGEEYADRQAYSYHNYCANLDAGGDPSNALVCEGEQLAQWVAQMADTKTHGCGSMLTEFGAYSDNSSAALEDIEWLTNLADKHFQGWAYWQFKAYNDFTTTSSDAESFYHADGTLQTAKVHALSRVYAQAIAGDGESMSYDPRARKFVLRYRLAARIALPTEIFVPEHAAPRGVAVTVEPSGAASWQLDETARRVLVFNSAGAKDGTSVTVTVLAK
eukprot:m51a1_g11103 putative cellulase (glycosyl hydrolase family 5) subfamily protein (512) ;mRNA; r:55237-57808